MDPQVKQGSKHMRTPVLGVAGNLDVEKGSYEKSSVDIGCRLVTMSSLNQGQPGQPRCLLHD
jgi:hypothetical protein